VPGLSPQHFLLLISSLGCKNCRHDFRGECKELLFFTIDFFFFFFFKVDKLKAEGNKFMKVDKYDEAVEKYSEAIEKDPSNHVLYSNRSAAYSKKEDYEKALKDAERTIELNSDWPKACISCHCTYVPRAVPMG